MMLLPAKKGVALTLVLLAVLATALFAAVTLRFALSQGKLNRHGINRIRAYYAAQAGVVYAMEMIRGGDWVPNATGGGDKVYCFNMPLPPAVGPVCPGGIGNNVVDADIYFPVVITISAYGFPDPAYPGMCSVRAAVNYAPATPY